MPLKAGKDKVGENIEELVESGRPRKQAEAIALEKARAGKQEAGKKKAARKSDNKFEW